MQQQYSSLQVGRCRLSASLLELQLDIPERQPVDLSCLQFTLEAVTMQRRVGAEYSAACRQRDARLKGILRGHPGAATGALTGGGVQDAPVAGAAATA